MNVRAKQGGTTRIGDSGGMHRTPIASRVSVQSNLAPVPLGGTVRRIPPLCSLSLLVILAFLAGAVNADPLSGENGKLKVKPVIPIKVHALPL